MLFNAYGLRRMRIAVERRFDTFTSTLFQLFAIIQFHTPFWMGRTLPNMFAFSPGKFFDVQAGVLQMTPYNLFTSDRCPLHVDREIAAPQETIKA
jgi:hypothetical protein